MAKTEEEKLNDAKFANRRKMAFWSLYAILFVTISVVIKILIMPNDSSVETYTPILSWSLSVLGGVVLAYIGAASYEQSADRSKIKLVPSDDKQEDEDDYHDENDYYGRMNSYRDRRNDGHQKTYE